MTTLNSFNITSKSSIWISVFRIAFNCSLNDFANEQLRGTMNVRYKAK